MSTFLLPNPNGATIINGRRYDRIDLCPPGSTCRCCGEAAAGLCRRCELPIGTETCACGCGPQGAAPDWLPETTTSTGPEPTPSIAADADEHGTGAAASTVHS